MMYLSATGVTYEVEGDSYCVLNNEWVRDAYMVKFIELNMKRI